MSSKEKILNALGHTNNSTQVESELPFKPITFEDTISEFKVNLELVGGKSIELDQQPDIKDLVNELFPETGKLLSLTTDIESSFELTNTQEGKDLNDLNITVAEGHLAVAENGAIWINTDNLPLRSALFICQHLIIIVERNSFVNNMHEAFEKINFKNSDYGLFISGPSKTADIEQALVIGAHGPRSCTVIIK